ncbi:hypothetical protein L1987_78619 [Smallanthus sonchifolius]|uniref:Uncharacterized protein n=1 Tax=Smallanthus sonchifolius TaxID=185202 RepID=A0ACB8ZHN7_9ASTR|nr:hypothetical protein L1987_78619 [Smallanthus sonchifolius]
MLQTVLQNKVLRATFTEQSPVSEAQGLRYRNMPSVISTTTTQMVGELTFFHILCAAVVPLYKNYEKLRLDEFMFDHFDKRSMEHAICEIIKTLKENNNDYTWWNVTVKLAKSYGFCWGVERAVQIAYEAGKQFHERTFGSPMKLFINLLLVRIIRCGYDFLGQDLAHQQQNNLSQMDDFFLCNKKCLRVCGANGISFEQLPESIGFLDEYAQM